MKSVRGATGTRARVGTIAAALAATCLLAACGSSSKSSSSSSSSAASSGASSGAASSGSGSTGSSSGSTGSSSGSTGSSSGSTGSGSSSSSVADRVTAALAAPKQEVSKMGIKNIAALKGKTVYYVPISSDVPAFAVTAASLKSALATQGVKLVVCSGNFNPSQFNACFSQAIGAGAGAIVADSIPYQIVSHLMTAANAKGISVLMTDIAVSKGKPTGKHIAYIAGSNAQFSMAQDWAIQDSGGKADILELEASDSPESIIGIAKDSLPEVAKYCSGCKTTVLKFGSSGEQQLPSLVSAALEKDPNINYVFSEFDQYTSLVTQGIQQANDTSKVKVMAAAGTLSGLKLVASGSSPVKAEVVNNQDYYGWIDADDSMRLMAGQKAINYTIPVRLFDASNIKSITLSNAASATGAWFGSSAYRSQFQQLWSGK